MGKTAQGYPMMRMIGPRPETSLRRAGEEDQDGSGQAHLWPLPSIEHHLLL